MTNYIDWIFPLLLQNISPNETIEQLPELEVPIPLDQYYLACVGYIHKIKKIVLVRILHVAVSFKPLQGPHEIQLFYENENRTQWLHTEPFWVHSLTTLRRNIMGYQDRLSFERSTYLLYFPKQKCLKIKNIRGYLTLPWKQGTFQVYSSLQNQGQNMTFEEKEKQAVVSLRTKQQTRRLLQHILNAYCRELSHCSHTDLLYQFHEDIQESIQTIMSMYSEKLISPG
jgi:hypothetical protein